MPASCSTTSPPAPASIASTRVSPMEPVPPPLLHCRRCPRARCLKRCAARARAPPRITCCSFPWHTRSMSRAPPGKHAVATLRATSPGACCLALGSRTQVCGAQLRLRACCGTTLQCCGLHAQGARGDQVPPCPPNCAGTASDRASFPYSPSYYLYEGARTDGVLGDRCNPLVPVLIKRSTFCASSFTHARNFEQVRSSMHSLRRGPERRHQWCTPARACLCCACPGCVRPLPPPPPPHTHPTTITHIRGRAQYSSWALALSLKQAGQELVTFPDVMFQAHRWARQGLG